ncbi:MAG: hypothetical protein M1817_006418 [Caeruleum heppii]|nr:MAG: hypothetical protein M1817_006418 [Caeruleum heppii]
MFRSRFNDAFPRSLPHYGPQDIERGVVDTPPSEQVENLLCALLGLVLNRKKNPERGHFQRALEEAVLANTVQWPSAWEGRNPLHGGNNFTSMSPTKRLDLMRALIVWSLSSSEAVQGMIKEFYKQNRHDDDLNQPLSVQPWGLDGDKRRYWLIEGQDDTKFRLYRESNIKLKTHTWRSVASDIPELRAVAAKLNEEGSQAARRLSERITLAIPRFEATEEKRKRREYRLARKAQFTKAEPGFSLYEGRTRGKRIKYTYSSDEGEGSEAPSSRRSKNASGLSTPGEGHDGPVFTASGRQVKSRVGGSYGESTLSGQGGERSSVTNGNSENATGEKSQGERSSGRPQRSGLRQQLDSWQASGEHIPGYNAVDQMEDEEDAEDDAGSSGGDEYAGDDGDDESVPGADEAEEDMSDDSLDFVDGAGGTPGNRSLVIQLKYQGQTPEKKEEHQPMAPEGQHQKPIQPGTQPAETLSNGEAGIDGRAAAPRDATAVEAAVNGHHLTSQDVAVSHGNGDEH